MYKKTWIAALMLLALLVGIGLSGRLLAQDAPNAAQENAAALGTSFTYQGQLQDGGSPATGVYDFQFQLYDAASGGASAGGPLAVDDVTVSAGIFTVELDFGSSAFNGDARWLEISVRPGSSTGSYTTLTPRQPLTAAPYALNAATAPWSGLTGIPAGFADGTDDGLTSVTWNDIQNRPAGLDDGDDNTTYTAGDGLALNGTQFDIVTLPKNGHVNTTLHSTGTIGQYPSIIIGLDGLPIISYYDATDGDLEVFHCNDMSCSSGTQRTIDSNGIVGEYSSITIGRDGNPVISYYDRSNGDLKLAFCVEPTCSLGHSHTVVDATGDVGQWTSITTNEEGYAFISYYDATNGNLKVASCNALICHNGNSTIWTVDSGGDVGKYSSVVRSPQGDAYISYYDATNGNLKVARCLNMNCNSPTINTVDGTDLFSGEEEDVGLWTSITTLMDGYPVIAHAKADQANTTSWALLTHCTNNTCSAATTRAISAMSGHGFQFQGFSVTVTPGGQALIAFVADALNRVYVGSCRDLTCTDITASSSAVVGGSPRHTSITIGADGLPVFAYYDDNGGDLKAVHCSDLSCQPYLRRR